jgi:peroxiredoxin Q/BCP
VAKAYGIHNGRFSKRVTFIIDKEGNIAHLDSQVNVGTHGKDLVEKLRELQK